MWLPLILLAATTSPCDPGSGLVIGTNLRAALSFTLTDGGESGVGGAMGSEPVLAPDCSDPIAFAIAVRARTPAVTPDLLT